MSRNYSDRFSNSTQGNAQMLEKLQEKGVDCLTMRRLEVDATNKAIVPIISFPASGFACSFDIKIDDSRMIIKVNYFLIGNAVKSPLTRRNTLENPTLAA